MAEKDRSLSKSMTGGPSSLETKTYMVLGTPFDVDKRYEILNPVGTGAYGLVCEAQDHVTGEKAAIKKIERAFEHAIFTKRTLRELKIIRLLQHENIIGVKTIQLPLSRTEFNDLYLICELMETDLTTIIKSDQELTDEHVQFFIYQVLRGCKYMHSACILHRDLKPRNLLVNGNCDLKICDFGLARADIPNLKFKATAMTDYVATRWYRAPEVLLSYKKYSTSIDVWSVGCILAELLGRRPLFPGKDTQHQLELILNIVGTPTEEEIQSIPRPKSRDFVRTFGKRPGRNFQKMFPGANPLAIDLMKKMLIFDPNKRITIEEALEHPYLSSLHYPEDEPTTQPVSRFDFDFEGALLTGNDLKDLIYEEIMLYHFPNKLEQYEKEKEQFEKINAEMGKSVSFNMQVSSEDGSGSDEDEFF